MSKELENYRLMKDYVMTEYEKIISQMEEKKVAGRVNSATYRQLMGRKLTYKTIVDLYKLYDLS